MYQDQGGTFYFVLKRPLKQEMLSQLRSPLPPLPGEEPRPEASAAIKARFPAKSGIFSVGWMVLVAD
jgi:hypothetical protein